MAATQYPPATNGIDVTASISLLGSGITLGTGVGEFDLTLLFGNSVMMSATAVDCFGNAVTKQPTMTAQSTNGTPTASGEASENTAYPQPNGGGVVRDPWFLTDGLYPSSEVASISSLTSNAGVVTAENVGEAVVEWRTPDGRSGRLNVTVVNQ